MFAPSPKPLPYPVEIVLARSEMGLAQVCLQRRGSGPGSRTWKAVITVRAPVPHDPDAVLAQAHDFLVDDRDGPVGVVDDVVSAGGEGNGEIVVACGWFGRHLLTVGFEDVAEIFPAERRLTLRPDLPGVAEARRRERPRSRRMAERARGLLERVRFARPPGHFG
jgi:hypothetical protein